MIEARAKNPANGAPAAADTLTLHEAACAAGVPLDRARRIAASGALGPVEVRKGARAIPRDGVAGLKLAHEARDILTPEGRRRLVRRLLEEPEADTVRECGVSVDAARLRREAREGLERLAWARGMVSIRKDTMGGAPCIAGTRIPVHFIAGMHAEGDSVEMLLETYDWITREQLEAAFLYARAWPRDRRASRRRTFAGWKTIYRTTTPLGDTVTLYGMDRAS